MPGMASANSLCRHPQAIPTVFSDGLLSIFGTGGIKAASPWQKRRNEPLITIDQK